MIARILCAEPRPDPDRGRRTRHGHPSQPPRWAPGIQTGRVRL